MHCDKESWLVDVKTTAKRFIEIHYSKESSLFETFWSVFAFKIKKAIEVNNHSQPTLSQIDRVVTEISFTGGDSQDFITPIVTLTIAEVLHTLNAEKISAAELENIIHSSATRHGAKPSLVACLIRSLPVLCNEILICKDNNSIEAIISESPKPSEYRIWTEGKNIILNSIDNYKNNEGKYMFWLDLNAKTYISPKSGSTLDPGAVRLLQHLVEHIGTVLSIEKVIDVAYNGNASLTLEHDKGKIAQHITQLNNFCGGKTAFDSYLFSKWRQNGLGLCNDFSDKYFLFSRVIPSND